MTQKNVFHLTLTIALEATNSDEAYKMLLEDQMIDQIKKSIMASNPVIVQETEKKKPLLS